MSNEIEKHRGEIERAPNGKRVRSSKAQLMVALAPMFAAFPGLTMGDDTFNFYWLALCDNEPDILCVAVMEACEAHKYPMQLVTVAAIKECLPQSRPPGPSSDIDWNNLPPAPPGGFKMFRLPDEEDRRQRMERLRNTSKWGNRYG